MESNKDQFRFMGMGLPWFFMTATALSCFPAFLFIKRNTENVLAINSQTDPVAYRDRFVKTVALLITCSSNVLLCNFLYFTAGAQYAFFTCLLSLVAAVSLFHPERFMYSKVVALSLVGWEAVNSGAVFLSPGILDTISNCKLVYGSYADVMCTDGWVSFSVFCAILLNGFTFLLCILLVEVAIDDSGRVLQMSRAEAQYAPIEDGYGSVDKAQHRTSTTSDRKSAAALPPSSSASNAVAKKDDYAPSGGHYERIADDEE